MDKKKNNKQVELNYKFDRLGLKKLSIVYAILVPNNLPTTSKTKEIENEVSSHLHQSILGSTEGSSDD